MATKFFKRPRKSSKRGGLVQSALAAVACTTALSVVAPAAPAVAKEPDPAAIIGDLTDKLSSGSASVSDLATALAGVEDEISRIEGEIGTYREAVNQALVDLQDARSESIQAKNGTHTARGELDKAQKELDKAKEKLDELSRTAYRRASTSDAVTNAAGQDAREDMLERRSFLREETEDQKKVVDQLERVRTEKANKESQLRKAEELANKRVDRAKGAETAARDKLSDSQSNIESSLKKREELKNKEAAAQAAIDDAHAGAKKDKAGKTDSNAATSTTSRSKATPQAETASTPKSTAKFEHDADAENKSAGGSKNSGGSDKGSQSTARSTSAQSEPSQTNSESTTTPADKDASSGKDETAGNDASAMTDAQKKELVDAAFSAAADIVADSQPEHTAFDEAKYEEGSKIPAIQYDGAGNQQGENESSTGKAGSSSSSLGGSVGSGNGSDGAPVKETETETEQGSDQPDADSGEEETAHGITNAATGEDEDLVNDLGGVLEQLDTSESISEEAGEKVANKSRNEKVEAVIDRAMSQIGVPYAWGGGDANGPTKGISDGGVADANGDYNKVGFDCSGLIIYAFAAAGISLPHFTGYQYQRGEKVDPSQMERGDLIFYGPNGSEHVALYLGDGQMLEAPQSGSTVSVSPVRQAGMAPYAVRLI